MGSVDLLDWSVPFCSVFFCSHCSHQEIEIDVVLEGRIFKKSNFLANLERQ